MASDPKLSNELFGRYHDTIRTQDITLSGTFRTPLPLEPLKGRRDFLLYNYSSTTVFIGGSNVSKHIGIPVTSGTIFTIPAGRVDVYGITGGTTASGIRIMEIA